MRGGYNKNVHQLFWSYKWKEKLEISLKETWSLLFSYSSKKKQKNKNNNKQILSVSSFLLDIMECR